MAILLHDSGDKEQNAGMVKLLRCARGVDGQKVQALPECRPQRTGSMLEEGFRVLVHGQRKSPTRQ